MLVKLKKLLKRKEEKVWHIVLSKNDHVENLNIIMDYFIDKRIGFNFTRIDNVLCQLAYKTCLED